MHGAFIFELESKKAFDWNSLRRAVLLFDHDLCQEQINWALSTQKEMKERLFSFKYQPRDRIFWTLPREYYTFSSKIEYTSTQSVSISSIWRIFGFMSYILQQWKPTSLCNAYIIMFDSYYSSGLSSLLFYYYWKSHQNYTLSTSAVPFRCGSQCHRCTQYTQYIQTTKTDDKTFKLLILLLSLLYLIILFYHTICMASRSIFQFRIPQNNQQAFEMKIPAKVRIPLDFARDEFFFQCGGIILVLYRQI